MGVIDKDVDDVDLFKDARKRSRSRAQLTNGCAIHREAWPERMVLALR